ncbi:hypothetical protein [Bacillus mycoides]|uniref:Uncharacterized protein n=1 Tax=Bacillus mycoides TaxID=1405 RepID=A0A1E8B7H3_BACMY|nr:hypothetical protein [Bacillus mycoides]OFD70547.1 hypothetical protein BWGOE9_56220 [Bacillus mycoides]OFD71655.1 hypothetical protein BWGOE10_56530 [Bacillus mycoides]OFD79252.1 hypothetical protein BWGOE8_25100 [Bacillus mycoides]
MKVLIDSEYDFSDKYREVIRVFGINPKVRHIYNNFDFEENLDGITYITGCSGSGKTTLSKEICLHKGYVQVKKDFEKNVPIIDILNKNFKDTLYYLNMVGLSEPYLYITNYNNLSTGQQFRFDLAYMLSKGYKKIFIDEFCSYLDRPTAKIVSFNTQKLLRKLGISAILASAHDDLEEYLRPDNKISLNLDKEINILKKDYDKSNPFLESIKVSGGTYEDYLELEKYHYFPHSSEETNQLYNTVYYKLEFNGDLMGVIILKSPYSNDQEDEEFIEINSQVKILSRIILHPLIRGAGLSTYFFGEVEKLNGKVPMYVCSALAEYIPFFLNMGFKEIQEYELNKEEDYIFIEKYFEGFGDIDISQRDILLAEERALSKITFWQYKLYCALANKMPKYNEEHFKGFVTGVFNENDIKWLYEEIKFIKMKHYIKK